MNKMLMDFPTRLETARLLLRPYQARDGKAYYKVCQRNKAHLIPFEAGNPALYVQSEEDAEVLVRTFAGDWAKRDAFLFGGWDKNSHEWIVQVYVGAVNWDLPEFQIGYFVDNEREGQGYATEAVCAVLQFLFNGLKAHRVRLTCSERNMRSSRLAERCGFVREGHLRETHKEVRQGEVVYSGDCLYGLLREDFERAIR
jgi:RimJ/RimL family protein N-acetyltransferase